MILTSLGIVLALIIGVGGYVHILYVHQSNLLHKMIDLLYLINMETCKVSVDEKLKVIDKRIENIGLWYSKTRKESVLTLRDQIEESYLFSYKENSPGSRPRTKSKEKIQTEVGLESRKVEHCPVCGNGDGYCEHCPSVK